MVEERLLFPETVEALKMAPAAAVLLCFAWTANAAHADQQSITICGNIQVFDGDTLEIGPMLIRLHGIDAPEKCQKCTSASGGEWRCRSAASKRLEALIDGTALACEALDSDPYGRIIARCTNGGVDLGT